MSNLILDDFKGYLNPATAMPVEKKNVPLDSKEIQYQALWQRSVISGALRESLVPVPPVQAKNLPSHVDLVRKVEGVSFFDPENRQEKKRDPEHKETGKKKLRCIEECVLLLKNQARSKSAPFKGLEKLKVVRAVNLNFLVFSYFGAA